MGRVIFWVSLAAALVGVWWAFGRRAQAAPGQRLALPPAGQLDPTAAYVRDLLASQQAQAQGLQQLPYLPPIEPTAQAGSGPGSQLKGLAVQGAGVVGAAAATTACLGVGGGPICALAAPAGKVVGQLGAQGVLWTGGKAVQGVQAVGSGAVTAAKAVGSVASKLKFW